MNDIKTGTCIKQDGYIYSYNSIIINGTPLPINQYLSALDESYTDILFAMPSLIDKLYPKGWYVHLIDTKEEYPKPIFSQILGSPVVGLIGTFARSNIIKAPEIPDTVINMEHCFAQTTNLMESPEIPYSVLSLNNTFTLSSVEKIPTIQSSVLTMLQTFAEAKNLSGEITINANPRVLQDCFFHTGTLNPNKIILRGQSSFLQELAQTGDENKIDISFFDCEIGDPVCYIEYDNRIISNHRENNLPISIEYKNTVLDSIDDPNERILYTNRRIVRGPIQVGGIEINHNKTEFNSDIKVQLQKARWENPYQKKSTLYLTQVSSIDQNKNISYLDEDILDKNNIPLKSVQVKFSNTSSTLSSLSGEGKYSQGSWCTIKANEYLNGQFLYWTTENGIILSYDSEYKFMVTDDITIYAQVHDNTPRQINIIKTSDSQGDLTFRLKDEEFFDGYYDGSVYTIYADEGENTIFLYWFVDGKIIKDNPLHYPVNGDGTIVAVSDYKKYWMVKHDETRQNRYIKSAIDQERNGELYTEFVSDTYNKFHASAGMTITFRGLPDFSFYVEDSDSSQYYYTRVLLDGKKFASLEGIKNKEQEFHVYNDGLKHSITFSYDFNGLDFGIFKGGTSTILIKKQGGI